ncbi:MAG: hypothetical protein GEU94_20665 [Micromonosporaceae bacterium]|nr:hypothetical protein [Micromonosporaceae bacterium]
MSLLVKRGDSPQDRFAAEILEIFRADGRVADAWYDRQQFAIAVRTADSAAVLVRLDEVYEEWGAADGVARAEPLRQFVTSAVAPPSMPETWVDAGPLVRPALCGITAALPPEPDPESGALWRHAFPYLAETVVLDLPGHPQVSVAQVNRWGVSAETVVMGAQRNLATRAIRPQQGGANVLRLVDDGTMHCVAQLTLDGWLAGFGPRLGGRPVAFAPDRSTLLVAPDDPGLLASLFEMAEEEYGQSARPVSPMAYTVTNAGRVVPYAAPPGHPLHAAVGRAERVLAAAEYGRQKRWLEDAGSPHRVGSMMLSGRADATIFSVATVAKDSATLLPKADYVAVISDDGDMFFVAWESAEQILGLKPEANLEPPRFLADVCLPGGSQEALRAAAVNPSAARRR